MRVSLLPRLKSHGVATILERITDTHFIEKNGIHLLQEYSALKSSASSGGVRADSMAVSITAKLREIAREAGFPASNTKQSRAEFDRKAAIYLGLRDELKTGEALRDDVWAFMTTVLAPDVTAWRFPERSRDRTARFAGGVRNCFQRLWVRGVVLDRGEVHPERWELIKTLSEDAMVQLFERASIGGNPTFAIAIAEGWLRINDKVGRNSMQDIMRSATKILRVKNQIFDLTYLCPKELQLIVSESFEIATNTPKNKKKLSSRNLI